MPLKIFHCIAFYKFSKLACDAFQKHQHLQGLFRRQMRSMADPKQISCSSRCHGIYQGIYFIIIKIMSVYKI